MPDKANDIIKLSSPATRDYWEVPLLFEDEYLLALNKPPRLLSSPDRHDPKRPNLMNLLHEDIKRGAPWVRARPELSYLMIAHRLEVETSGVILLAKSKPMLVALANLFGSEKVAGLYAALVHGSPEQEVFSSEARLAPHPSKTGLMRVEPKRGRRSRSDFQVCERFARYALLQCRPRILRCHQIRVHLQHAGFPLVGDMAYGGRRLLLSGLKSDYRLKPNATERPLISSTALHLEKLSFVHPVKKTQTEIAAPWPKDFTVGVKYLRRYVAG